MTTRDSAEVAPVTAEKVRREALERNREDLKQDGGERLYFVVETKSSAFLDDLRDKERAKVKCGEAHFDALRLGKEPAEYVRAHSVDEVLTHERPS